MDINSVLKNENFRFSKGLGQNFITDTNLLRAIVNDAGVTESDTVVEIGAGAGTLTKEISERAAKVISFEIDERLKTVLAQTLKNCENVEVVFADILKTKREDLHLKTGGRFKVVANLPYYITTPILFWFLEDSLCESLTVMVQKEVAHRITACAGTAEYGALSVQVRILSEPVCTRIVSRKLFNPAPNVDSAVVRMDINKKEGIKDLKVLKRVIASAFAMRRKTLLNNLIKDFSLPRENIEGILAAAGVEKNARGETLDARTFIKLAAYL